MSGKVRITKDGLRVEPAVSTVLAALRSNCAIDDGVTLGDIFRAVEPHRDLVEVLRAWSHCNVDAFHAEARKPAADATELLYIEVLRWFRWDPDEACSTVRVRGVGEPYEDGMIHYGVDMMPISKMVNVPVRIRPSMEIFEGSKLVADVPCEFTLLDVLGEIYWEISFFGSPDERSAKVEELTEMARQIRGDPA